MYCTVTTVTEITVDEWQYNSFWHLVWCTPTSFLTWLHWITSQQIWSNSSYTALWKLRHRPALTIPGPPHLLTKVGLKRQPRSANSQDSGFTNHPITSKITGLARDPSLASLKSIQIEAGLSWRWGAALLERSTDRHTDCCSAQFPTPEAGPEGLHFTLLSSKRRRNSQEVTDISTSCGKLKESSEITHASYFTTPLALTYHTGNSLVGREWKKQTTSPAQQLPLQPADWLLNREILNLGSSQTSTALG